MATRDPEKEVIPLCEALGIGFVCWWPLDCQLLTGWIDENTRFAPGDLRAATPRFAAENLPQNLKLVELIKTWAARKQVTPPQIALAWLMAQKPWIVPIPGTTVMQHMVDNSGADGVKFTSSEIAEFNSAVRAIEIKGQRLPDAVLVFSGVEAPVKK
jgi:aryl-alcohol dehydrogenase-like predicted oxidoreductase